MRVTGVAGAYTWTVPAGKRAVIKSIAVANGAAAGTAIDVSVAGVVIYLKVFQATNSSDVQNLHQVVYGGEFIRVGLGAAGLHVGIAGFLFDDPSKGHYPGAEVEYERLEQRPELGPVALDAQL